MAKHWTVRNIVTEAQYRALIHAGVALELEAQDDDSAEMRRDLEELSRLTRKLSPPRGE